MIVLINGDNRIELCEVKKKDYNKRLFQHRGQLYSIFPEDLIPLDYLDSGARRTQKPTEILIYNEGA